MPSQSLLRWRGERSAALDEIESAHVAVGGTERGRRYATQQINYSYATLLTAQFQGFCRDLHTESVRLLVTVLSHPIQGVVRTEFLWNRSLDKSNPHPGAIGSDFNRLGLLFWKAVDGLNPRNRIRGKILQELIDWRNAIAHQDFDPILGSPKLHLAKVRRWRKALNVLADSFDGVMYNYLEATLGQAPW